MFVSNIISGLLIAHTTHHADAHKSQTAYDT
jgi:hypothetical protein